MGKPIEELKIVSCHMGNGSSICAVDGGKCVDTSMGFTRSWVCRWARAAAILTRA